MKESFQFKKPVIIAMVGLVGSGKSSVARAIGRLVDAAVISGDDIRVALRRQGKKYERARRIAEKIAERHLRNGKSVVLDSDFIDAQKRKSLEKKARAFGTPVFYVRAHAEPDIMIGCIISAQYRKSPYDFFGGASSAWKGKESGAVVKLREMWRRTPHHMRWSKKGGGAWTMRRFSFLFADIDTTDRKSWKKQVLVVAGKIQKGR